MTHPIVDLFRIALRHRGDRAAILAELGFLTGGYGNQNKDGTHQQHRERLWASPACDATAQGSLFP